MKNKIVNCLEEDLLRIEWDKNEALRMQHELIAEPADVEAIFDFLMETNKLKDEKRKTELEASLQPLICYLQTQYAVITSTPCPKGGDFSFKAGQTTMLENILTFIENMIA